VICGEKWTASFKYILQRLLLGFRARDADSRFRSEGNEAYENDGSSVEYR